VIKYSASTQNEKHNTKLKEKAVQTNCLISWTNFEIAKMKRNRQLQTDSNLMCRTVCGIN